MDRLRKSTFVIICAFFLLLFSHIVCAAIINYSGQLDVYLIDNGSATYSGSDRFTKISGSFDTAITSGVNGSISDGATATSVGCCIAAGGFNINNDYTLPAAEAKFYNSVLGINRFKADGTDKVVTVDIESDAATTGGGRIEVGLNFILDENAVTDLDPNNLPFDQSDIILTLFFIYEEDNKGDDLFDAVGQLDSVQLSPPAKLTAPLLPFLFQLLD